MLRNRVMMSEDLSKMLNNKQIAKKTKRVNVNLTKNRPRYNKSLRNDRCKHAHTASKTSSTKNTHRQNSSNEAACYKQNVFKYLAQSFCFTIQLVQANFVWRNSAGVCCSTAKTNGDCEIMQPCTRKKPGKRPGVSAWTENIPTTNKPLIRANSATMH